MLTPLTGFMVLLALLSPAHGRQARSLSGTVRDSDGAVVVDAQVSLMSARQAVIAVSKTDSRGHFSFSMPAAGHYVLVVTTPGFDERRAAVHVGDAPAEEVEITVEPRAVSEQVTVTATPGVAENVERVPQEVNIIDAREIDERAKTVTAQVAQEEVGVHLQRTSPTIAGVFVRGLTGNKVNVFIDGVRYSTSAARGGINTFLNLVESSNLDSVEILRGSNSAQYGSDALGGSIQFLSLIPPYSQQGSNVRGKLSTFFNTSDASFGSTLTTSFATETFGVIANVAGRRVNTLRPGGGIDSHNAVTRFFGVSSEGVIGSRLPDTAFTQYGGMLKMSWAPTTADRFVINYTRGQQDGGKRYDQLLGGDGNLVADLRNLMLDLFYVKYDRVKLGWFDGFSAVYSFNSQREERVNQGGGGNPLASINHEYERTNVNGAQLSASKQLGTRQNLLFGAEFYHERIDSPAFGVNPASNSVRLRRPRVPDNARFISGGVYAQDVFDWVPNRLRLIGNVRYSAASYRARAEDSPLVGGERLWPDDSLRVSDASFRGGVVVTPVDGLNLVANISRGFRAPHMTDLGTLGLTGSGFEVAAPDVAGLGAQVGTTADRTAVATGIPVTQVGPETSLSYEAGVRYRNRRVDTELAFFVNDIYDNIVKQALILPPGAVGLEIGGQPITSQNSNGVVFVDATSAPVLVRANFDDARIYGFEHELEVEISRQWTASTVFTYLYAEDKRTGLPPNIEGGTPAPDGWLKIRYVPARGRFWVEPYIHAAGRQGRIASLALEDRRTGAARSRDSIEGFFFNGATARGFVGAGPDGARGTADDVLLATGETLAQIQDRVLGPGEDSSPLFTAIPGYVTFNVRGGVKFGERHEIIVDFENIGDRNYRGVSWGVDAPGRGVYVRYNTRF
ncbi:MAG TPA: TonB-dependent receptor [Blastocatellia bacterium]|nr:TonB-dependent receptor [Blastocatellia bacterium]